MSNQTRSTGALLINLGTPDAPTTPAVRRFLAEFLSDPRVLTLPGPLRFLLLHGIILRVRPKRSAAAYAEIWQPEGSPLMIHGRALHAAVEKTLGDTMPVELAMRYGQPNVDQALQRLSERGVQRLIVLPLFPQYSEACTGSILAHVEARSRKLGTTFERVEIEHFFENPAFIRSATKLARPVLNEIDAEHLLMSFHGLPESQVKQVDGCLAKPDCCEHPKTRLNACYRAQCFATGRALHTALGLGEGQSTVAFQSRLGRQPWIQPYTDQVIQSLRDRGVRRLAVMCPAFVADNIETLEEIGLRLREDWLSLGGESFALVPCVNAEPEWVQGVAQMVTEAATA